MPRIVEDSDLDSQNMTADTEQEVAPIANQLGEIPQIEDLANILDPYAPAPSAVTSEPSTQEENAHAH